MEKNTSEHSAAAHLGISHTGSGGETHQTAQDTGLALTTNQGTRVSDNQNSLRNGPRGPTLLEDFILREKITHFDHERIPERIVHARGSGAHGYFQAYTEAAQVSKADFLQNPQQKTEVFARFSTVAGGAGSADCVRDVRGFAVKFYTQAGNFDLVGNNIPVFFIQDAMKFPDLIHSVKMEPDRGFPQAASAHDTFWDFASLMPESMHMLMWAMSDRAIPRSYRMMEGFGVHTFRLIDHHDHSHFVKFHWRPVLGATSLVWDEAVKINGADPDFHRRDLWEAIDTGNYPEYELCIQRFDQKTADALAFDMLDPTKLIPEEIIPLQPIGKMVLNRNPDNFFAETEQVAFHPGHVVPGIDFSNDPLLQGRLHSYTDTQLSRLGGPNFHEIPINRPRCPMHNFQRDGLARMDVAKGRVAYEPNSLDTTGPRECPSTGFKSFPDQEAGVKQRLRSDSFSDHYSQARLFFQSMSAPEQRHITAAFGFELGKVQTLAIRQAMVGHLKCIDTQLGTGVEQTLGMSMSPVAAATPIQAPQNFSASDSLSLIKKFQPTLQGRKIGIFINDGFDEAIFDTAIQTIQREKASFFVIAPTVGPVKSSQGKTQRPDGALEASPSVLFDAVMCLISTTAIKNTTHEDILKEWLNNAYRHLKTIAYTPTALSLLKAAGSMPDQAVIEIDGPTAIDNFISQAKNGKIWAREKF